MELRKVSENNNFEIYEYSFKHGYGQKIGWFEHYPKKLDTLNVYKTEVIWQEPPSYTFYHVQHGCGRAFVWKQGLSIDCPDLERARITLSHVKQGNVIIRFDGAEIKRVRVYQKEWRSSMEQLSPPTRKNLPVYEKAIAPFVKKVIAKRGLRYFDRSDIQFAIITKLYCPNVVVAIKARRKYTSL